MTLRATHVHARADDYAAPGGPWDVPALHDLLDVAALGAADRVLLVDDTERVDGAALAERVGRVAGWLSSRGVAPGEVVAWQAPNATASVVLLRACWSLGAVAVPLHPQWRGTEIGLALAALGNHHLVDVEHDADGWRRAHPVEASPVGAHDLAAVLFTSGSSGAPKGVIHSHATLACKASTMAAWHGLGPDDAVLMPAPVAHVSGLLNGVTLPGCVPFRAVLMARWDPARALDLIEREQITFMVGPPTFFVAMMRSPGFAAARVATMRVISSGGAGVGEAFVEEASEAFGCTVKRTYGSTEAPTVATSTPDDVPEDARWADGRAVGAAELRIVDPASGDALASGAVGELWVRGPELCCGYLDPVATAASFTDDGWFRTADLAAIDGSGWLTVAGRVADVIIRGGENVAAADVEEHLEAHPRIHQAVAVGFPDDLMGERVCAFVVSDGDVTPEECRRWFEERGAARYKAPERLVRIGEVPVLPTGKPDRAALRAEAARRFRVSPRGH